MRSKFGEYAAILAAFELGQSLFAAINGPLSWQRLAIDTVILVIIAVVLEVRAAILKHS